MPARKRARAEIEDDDDTPVPAAQPPSTLQRIRNMWEFASFMQYLFFFGKAIRAEEWEVEDFEDELLKPEHSQRLSALALSMLKSFSSFRPLNLDTFEEDIRRRYDRKGVQNNPFGYEEEPHKFASLDVFTKIRVLQQLSVWTFNNPDRIREKMPEKESEHTYWRMDPLGWDEDERAYFVFDDDRLYRRTDAPLPPEPEPKSKAKGKNSKKTRSAKKRRISRPVVESSPDVEDEEEALAANGVDSKGEEPEEEDDGLGGMKWELIAITLDEYNAFLDPIRRSRDANTKTLVKRLTSDVLPTIEKRADLLRQKELRKLRDLENLEKLATAKRSSRLAGKAEQKKVQEEVESAERKRQEELEMAHREQAKQRKLEEDRESRMMTREQRLKEREVKRILHEEDLKKLEEDKERIGSDEARLSERHLKAEMEKKRQELEKLAQEEDWTFDCAKCGLHGQNLDDGSHSIACDKCSVWQHSACHGIKKVEAEREDFHFVCTPCKRKADRDNQPKIPPMKFRFSSPATEQRQVNGQARPPSSQGQMPPIGRFDAGRAATQPGSDVRSPNGHTTSFASRPSSSHQANPMTSVPQLQREAASPAATANFRYSLQRGDSASSPPSQPAYSPPPQSWNHQYAHPGYANGAHRPQPSPNAANAYSISPPMGNFGAYRPPSQNGTPQATPSFARPPSQGTSQVLSPTLARHPPPTSPPRANGHSNGAVSRPSSSHSGSGAEVHRTPTVAQSHILHSASRAPSGHPASSPAPGFLSTPQYAAPRPPVVHTPLPAVAGISPLKQESPRLTPAPVFASSPSIMPPATTLTPTYGNIQHNSPPVKKSSPPGNGQQQGALPAVAASSDTST